MFGLEEIPVVRGWAGPSPPLWRSPAAWCALGIGLMAAVWLFVGVEAGLYWLVDWVRTAN
jgi:hypothetical protein